MRNQSNQTEGPATNINRREGSPSRRRTLSLVVSPPSTRDHKSPQRDGRASMTTGSEPSAGTGLGALLAAIKNSPIVVRLTGGLAQVRDWASWQKVPWASVRRSPDVDAYVLAWIASHVRTRRPRSFI